MPRVSVDQREQYFQDRREQILDAAIEIFGCRGFSWTNVSDIALEAGVAKGTVYLYFESKEAIFNTILTERSFIPYLTRLELNDDKPLEETLVAIAENYYRYMEENLPLFRLALTDAHHFPDHSRQVFQAIVLKGSQILADYLQAQSRAGKIRKLEAPLLTAQAFMGMLANYIITQEILGGKLFNPVETKDWIQEIVHLFMEGVHL
jgi:AcrR family transcriptional regulator